MITEIEVHHSQDGFDYVVVFRVASKNDGGQSDQVSEPTYFIDGEDYELENLWDDADVRILKDMYGNYVKYHHTVKEIKDESEYD